MRKKEVAAKLNKASILFFLLSSLIILMLPFADSETNSALSIASGVIFWAGLILGIVCYYLSYKNIKDVQEYQTLAKRNRIGALAPGSTREGMIVDILFVPTFVISILGTFVMLIPSPVMLVSMWVALVTLYGHFVLNGRVYKFLHMGKERTSGRKTSKSTTSRRNQKKKKGEKTDETRN